MIIDEIDNKNVRLAHCSNCDYMVPMKRNKEQILRDKFEKKGW